jgi:hypothetical protein
MWTMLFSGPDNARDAAAAALQGAGLTCDTAVTDHQDMPDASDDNVSLSGRHGWLTCTGASVDVAAAAVADLDWQLRAHHPS